MQIFLVKIYLNLTIFKFWVWTNHVQLSENTWSFLRTLHRRKTLESLHHDPDLVTAPKQYNHNYIIFYMSIPQGLINVAKYTRINWKYIITWLWTSWGWGGEMGKFSVKLIGVSSQNSFLEMRTEVKRNMMRTFLLVQIVKCDVDKTMHPRSCSLKFGLGNKNMALSSQNSRPRSTSTQASIILQQKVINMYTFFRITQ